MKKRSLVISVAVVAAVALAAVPFVYAQGFHRHHADAGGSMHGMMFFGHLQRVKAALDLSDAQVDQLKAIAQALLANPNDLAAAQALIDQQTTAERTMKMNVLAGVSKALNVLTPDQRAKASQFLADRAAREK